MLHDSLFKIIRSKMARKGLQFPIDRGRYTEYRTDFLRSNFDDIGMLQLRGPRYQMVIFFKLDKAGTISQVLRAEEPRNEHSNYAPFKPIDWKQLENIIYVVEHWHPTKIKRIPASKASAV